MKNKITPIIISILFIALLFIISCSKQTEEVDVLTMNLREHKNLALHIHPIVEIEIKGEEYVIPAEIGISPEGMRAIHTHDKTGKLHVESPFPHQFYLKDFFTIWGESFTKDCIFEFCVDETYSLITYVNGETNDLYGLIPLHDGDKIKIVFSEFVSE